MIAFNNFNLRKETFPGLQSGLIFFATLMDLWSLRVETVSHYVLKT